MYHGASEHKFSYINEVKYGNVALQPMIFLEGTEPIRGDSIVWSASRTGPDLSRALNLVAGSFELQARGTNGTLTVGNTISTTCNFTLINKDYEYDNKILKGRKIYPFMYLEHGGYKGLYNLGIFEVLEARTNQDLIPVSCIDQMYKLEKTGLTISTGTTVSRVLQDICSLSGIPASSHLTNVYIIGSGTGKLEAKEDVEPEVMQRTTLRETLGAIAAIMGGFAKINRAGELDIRPLFLAPSTFDPHYNFNNLARDSSEVETEHLQFTGVEYDLGGKEKLFEGEPPYILSIKNHPLLDVIPQNWVFWLYNNIKGSVPLWPYSMSVTSDPTIETGDLIEITHRGNRYYSMVLEHNLTANTFSTISCPGLSVPASMTGGDDVSRVRVTLEKQRNRIDRYKQAADAFNKFVTSGSGLYSTEKEMPDGKIWYYWHNLPTLEESDVIWQLSENGFSVSNDGGENWRGMDKNGNFLAVVLSTIGLNADWINAGMIDAERIRLAMPDGSDPSLTDALWDETTGKFIWRDDMTEFDAALYERLKGEDAREIKSNLVQYNKSPRDATEPPGEGWTSKPPKLSGGEVMWTRMTILYDDGTATASEPMKIKVDAIAETGAQYAITLDTNPPAADAWSDLAPTEWVNGTYVWTRHKTVDTEGNVTYGPPVCLSLYDDTAVKEAFQQITAIDERVATHTNEYSEWKSTVTQYQEHTDGELERLGVLEQKVTKVEAGEITISGLTNSPTLTEFAKSVEGAKAVDYVDVQYNQAPKGAAAPTSGWQTKPPDLVQGNRLWTRTILVYEDGSVVNSKPTVIYTGTDDMDPVDDIIEEYATTTNLAAPDTGWSTERPDWNTNNFIWTRTRVLRVDGSYNYTPPVCISLYDDTAVKAAQRTADNAKSAANEANYQITKIKDGSIFIGSTRLSTIRDNAAAGKDAASTANAAWDKVTKIESGRIQLTKIDTGSFVATSTKAYFYNNTRGFIGMGTEDYLLAMGSSASNINTWFTLDGTMKANAVYSIGGWAIDANNLRYSKGPHHIYLYTNNTSNVARFNQIYFTAEDRIRCKGVDQNSDVRLKTDIALPGYEDLAVLDQIQIKSFRMLTDSPSTKRYGVIAQEVQDVLPGIVSEGSGADGDDFLGVDYTSLNNLGLLAIQDLRRRVDQLELQLGELL